eukprot:11711694-Ditylum_brightwellii.AAC.2
MHTEAGEEDRKWCKMRVVAREDQRKHGKHVMTRVCDRQALAEIETIERMRESGAKVSKGSNNTATGPSMGSKGEERMGVQMQIMQESANRNNATNKPNTDNDAERITVNELEIGALKNEP